MPEWISTVPPEWVLVICLASMSVLMALILIAIAVLIGVVRKTQDQVGESLHVVREQIESISTSMESSGPIRFALAGLVAIRRESQLSREEIQGEMQRLLEDYREVDDIVAEIKTSLSTLDEQSREHDESKRTGEPK